MKENKFRVYCEIEFEGKITKSMESSASWFMLTQTGKLWTYDPVETPRPIEKEYKVAIPLFYIGEKDKNGKEIYEGDIIKFKGKKWDDSGNFSEPIRIEIVKFENSSFYAENMYEEDCYEIEWNEVEIIGNKYMNEDLLLEEK